MPRPQRVRHPVSFARPIDLRSDTVTQPTRGMRQAMANAEVGDDLLDGDPTTRRLEDRVAALLGADRALFFPTGTMANQAAVWLHAPRGTELLADPDSHLMRREVAACAALCGVQPRTMLALRADQPAGRVEAAVEDELMIPTPARVSLICLENTHNSAGGVVLQPRALQGVTRAAHHHGIAVHVDGARLWNAATALDMPPQGLTRDADTVTVCFDKGLGAPAGSALAGRGPVMDDARRVRRRFGGTMRQSGILAAAALYALDHHMAELAADHERARRLARSLGDLPGVAAITPQTNVVMLDLAPPRTATDVAAQARSAGVLVAVWTPSRLRLVTHRDVDDRGIEVAISVLTRILTAPVSPARVARRAKPASKRVR